MVEAVISKRSTVQGVRSYGGHFHSLSIPRAFYNQSLEELQPCPCFPVLAAFANCSQSIPPEQSRRSSISPPQASVVAKTETEVGKCVG